MVESVRLGPQETAGDRAFTAPAHTARDLAAVATMLAALRRAARSREPDPAMLERREAGRVHRTIICDLRRLSAGQDLAWVGFFAARRRDRDAAPLTRADDELIREFPQHPGVLSYSSLELADGNWGNLILLADAAARERWSESARHAQAVRELAPRHYHHVRLHLGILPGGAGSGAALRLERTRYIDYRDAEPWRAERAWLGGAPGPG